MRFENTFDVDAPLEQVWSTVLDVERVAPTVPGAQVLEQTSENAYKVGIKVKVGPMSMTYKGEVEITERDDEAHRAVMKARAKESRGQGTADADVTMVLRGDDGRTSATVTTDVELSGKAAAMGQGVLQDVAGRLVQTFAKNLATMLAGGEAAGGGAPAAAAGSGGATTSDHAPDEAAGAAAEPTAGASGAPGSGSGAAGGSGASADASGAAGGSGAGGGGAAAAAAPRFDGGEDALDLGEIGGAMMAERLKDPRIVAVIAIVAFLLGRRSAR